MDKKQKKKLKRVSKKKKHKAEEQRVQSKLKKTISSFKKRPDECSACKKKFPLTREAHMSWRVVVKNKKQQVRLFCPDCQNKAKQLLEKNNEI